MAGFLAQGNKTALGKCGGAIETDAWNGTHRGADGAA